MRTLAQLDAVSPQTWTEAEALAHLTDTFNANASQYPDVMERYVILLEGSTDAERTAIMRRGLRDTINQRHPHPLTLIEQDRMRRAQAIGRHADKLARQEEERT